MEEGGGGGRRLSRRTTKFNGDYQANYGDIDFESEDEKPSSRSATTTPRAKRPSETKSRTKGRTKECPGCGAFTGLSTRECSHCDYQFTSKSMAVSNFSAVEESESIREKFPFEPERDEGSLIISSIIGRRPRKSGKRYLKSGERSSGLSASDSKFDHEYLLKYKTMSYLHVEWRTANEIEAMNGRSKQLLNRYLNKIDRGEPVEVDGEIDPSFTEIEKILDVAEEEVTEIIDELPKQDQEGSSNSKDKKNEKAKEQLAEEKEEEDDNSGDESVDGDKVLMRRSSRSDLNLAASGSGHSAAAAAAAVSTRSGGGISDELRAELPMSAIGYSEVKEDGTEVARTPAQIFQAPYRCRKILEKIWEDPFAESFQEPVDTDTYTDYLDSVETPICLQDIKDKLDRLAYSKYQGFLVFANDMRLVFKNCKAYNQYQSAIWHCAHSLSLLFERLFQSWVISYKDGGMALMNPLARPWEASCRGCLKDGDDDHLILCDHCDAQHHIFCLKPPLAAVPEDNWVCHRCTKWARKTNNAAKEAARAGSGTRPTMVKLLSAAVEEEARACVEKAGHRKTVVVRKKKYLVKWRGLSYRECSWETVKDLEDDDGIAEFHRLNDSPPDEPPLTQAEIGAELAKSRAQVFPATSNPNIHMDLDANVHAQIRAYHFLKYDKIPPDALLKECGPSAFGYTRGAKTPMLLPQYLSSSVDNVVSGTITVVGDKDCKGGDQDVDTSDTPSDVADKESADSEKMDVDADSSKAGADSGRDQDAVAKNTELKWWIPTHAYSAPDVDKDDSSVVASTDEQIDLIRNEVLGCLSDALYCVARNVQMPAVFPARTALQPFEVEVPIVRAHRHQGLYMNVAEHRDISPPGADGAPGTATSSTRVIGFRPLEDGRTMGPVQRTGKVKVGDTLVAINGTYVTATPFNEVCKMLRDADSNYTYLRFLRLSHRPENPPVVFAEYHTSEEDVLSFYFPGPFEKPYNRELYPIRSCYFGVFPYMLTDNTCKSVDVDSLQWFVEYTANDGSMDRKRICQPADAEGGEACALVLFSSQLEAALAYDKEIRRQNMEAIALYKAAPGANKQVVRDARHLNFVASDGNSDVNRLTSAAKALCDAVLRESKANQAKSQDLKDDYITRLNREPSARQKAITAAARDRVDGSDGEDDAVLSDDDAFSLDTCDSDSDVVEESDVEADAGGADTDNEEGQNNNGRLYRISRSIGWQEPEVTGDGSMGRLLRAVNQSSYAPNRLEWENHILELGMNAAMLEDYEAKQIKIEQIDITTVEVVKVWDSILAASKALNIPMRAIQQCMLNKLDVAGGFKWKRAASNVVDDDVEFAELKKEEERWKAKIPKKSPIYRTEGFQLRDYQVEGLQWLLRCWYTKRGSILADEMGLGKTVQVVSFLDHLFSVEGIRGPFLVCVPLSTIEHWRREAEGWSFMNVCVYHDANGGRDTRDVIREFEWYYKGKSRRLLKFHLLITTYDDLIKDYEELAEVPWRAVVVDEAHRLRNVNSKLIDCMRNICAKGQIAYGYQHRLLMTGTPLQNNTQELWSLLNFIEPAKFPDWERFAQSFGVIQTQEQVELLQRRISPHIIRRVKEDVAKDIPPKMETIIDVELTTMQKQYYRAIFERNLGFLAQGTKGALPKLMNIQMELRKCCNHPFLITGVEQGEMEALDVSMLQELEEKENEEAAANPSSSSAMKKRSPFSNFDSEDPPLHLIDDVEFESRRMNDHILKVSGKMVLLDKLLPKLRKEGHKVLIFSQMVRMIDIIEEYCEFRLYPVERLDGRVRGNERQKCIDRFNKQADSFVFLLSTRAGGVGINLTAADTVIIFDSDWNPQNDIQAMARCHRIGQTKDVTVYRLITRKSFESEMFERASKKLGLEQAILGSRAFNEEAEDAQKHTANKFDAKEMEKLLREGAYAVFAEDNSEEVKEFFDQDIDTLLDKRSHTIVHDEGGGGGDDDGGEGEGGEDDKKTTRKSKPTAFRKSLFTGDSAQEFADIDVNDPDFWKKVLPDLVTPDSMLQRLKSEFSSVDDDDCEELAEKFMADMDQLMLGILDLQRKNTLPDRERGVIMKLLLRLTINNEDFFTETDNLKAQEWLTIVEGTRQRRVRQQELAKPEQPATTPTANKKKGRRGKKRFGPAESSSDGEGDDDDDDAEQEEEQDPYDEDAFGERPRKRGRGPGKKNKDKTPKSAGGRRRRRRRGPDGELLPLDPLDVGEDGEYESTPKRTPGRKGRPPGAANKSKDKEPGGSSGKGVFRGASGKIDRRRKRPRPEEEEGNEDVEAAVEAEEEEEEEAPRRRGRKAAKVTRNTPSSVAAAANGRPRRGARVTQEVEVEEEVEEEEDVEVETVRRGTKKNLSSLLQSRQNHTSDSTRANSNGNGSSDRIAQLKRNILQKRHESSEEGSEDEDEDDEDVDEGAVDLNESATYL